MPAGASGGERSMEARMLYLHAISPIHSGTGQSADVVDLPVARERVFKWPYLPGSSIKGVLRDACGDGDPALVREAFGPDTANASDGAGTLWFADGHLLCLPVRSYYGTFAWVSCPLALRRWQRDHLTVGLAFAPRAIPSPAGGTILLPPDSDLAYGGRVFLEELNFNAVPDPAVQAVADVVADALFEGEWVELFRRRFAIVEDDQFTFLSETATEVVARIRLSEETKTVASGALWYEEAVPAEAIFSAPVIAAPRNGRREAELFDVLASATDAILQIGGSASVGRGLARAHLVGEGAPEGAGRTA